MKTRYLILALVCFFLAGYVAHAAGAATNLITLAWDAPTNSPVPYTYRLYSSTNMINWVVATNVPATQTQATLVVSKDVTLWFYATCVNATNGAWESDPSNLAVTLWPKSGEKLKIRLGL